MQLATCADDFLGAVLRDWVADRSAPTPPRRPLHRCAAGSRHLAAALWRGHRHHVFDPRRALDGVGNELSPELTMYTAKGQLDVNSMLKQYSSLVRRLAHQMIAKLPANVEIDDLIQVGMIGLTMPCRASTRPRACSFETFANQLMPSRGRSRFRPARPSLCSSLCTAADARAAARAAREVVVRAAREHRARMALGGEGFELHALGRVEARQGIGESDHAD